MIEIFNSVGFLISFDGRIIEEFSNTNTRMHISGVKGIEVKVGRKGDLSIMATGRWGGGFLFGGIDPNRRSAVDDLVAQVNAGIRAMGAVK